MKEKTKTSGAVLVAAAIFTLALALVAYAVIVSHYSAASQRRDFRDSVIFLARANCKEIDVIRQTTLARIKDPSQRAIALAFYKQLEQPISDALENLGAKPCQP